MKFLKSAFGQKKSLQLVLLFCATLCWVTNIFCPINSNQTAQFNEQDADTVLAFVKNALQQSFVDKTELQFDDQEAANTLSDSIHTIIRMKTFDDNNAQTAEVIRTIKKYHSELALAAGENNKNFVDGIMQQVVAQQLGDKIHLQEVLNLQDPSPEMNNFRLKNLMGYQQNQHGEKIKQASSGFFAKFKAFAKKVLNFFSPSSRKKIVDQTNNFIDSQPQPSSSTDGSVMISSRERQSDFRRSAKNTLSEGLNELELASSQRSIRSTASTGSDSDSPPKANSFARAISEGRASRNSSSGSNDSSGGGGASGKFRNTDFSSESFQDPLNLPMIDKSQDGQLSKDSIDDQEDQFQNSQPTTPKFPTVPALNLQNRNNRTAQNGPNTLVRQGGSGSFDGEDEDEDPDSSRGPVDQGVVTDKEQQANAAFDSEAMISSLLARVSDIDSAMHQALTIDGNFTEANNLLTNFFKEGVDGFPPKSAETLQKAIAASVADKDAKNIDFSAIVKKLDLGLTRIQALKLETILGTIHAQNQLVAASEYFQKQIDAQTLKQEEIKVLDDLIKKSMPSQNYVNRSQFNQLDLKTFNLEQDASKLAYIKSAVLANCLSSYSAEKKGLLAAQRTEELADGLTQNWSQQSADAWRKEQAPDEESGHDFIYFGVADVYSRAFNFGDSDAGKSFEAKVLMLQDFETMKKDKVVEVQEAFDPVLREVKGIISESKKITQKEEDANPSTKRQIIEIKNKVAKQQALYDLNKLSTDLLQAAVYSKLEQKIQPEKSRRLTSAMRASLKTIAAKKLELEAKIAAAKDQTELQKLQNDIEDQKNEIKKIMNDPNVTRANPLLNRIFADNMDLHRARIEQSLRGKNPFTEVSSAEVDKMIQDGVFDSKAHGVAKLSSLSSLKKPFFDLPNVASDVKSLEQKAAAIDNGLLTGKQIPLEQSQKLDAVRLLEENLADLSLDDNLQAAVRTVLRDVVDNSSFDPALMSSKIKEMHLLNQLSQDPTLFDSKILGTGLVQTEDDQKQDQEYLKNVLSQQIKDMINPSATKPFWDVRNADAATKAKYSSLLNAVFGTEDLDSVVSKYSANPSEIDKRLSKLKIDDFHQIRVTFFQEGAYNGPLLPLGEIDFNPKNWVNRETALRRVIEVTTDPGQLDVATRILDKVSQKPSPEESLKYFLQMNQSSDIDPSGDRLRRIIQMLDLSAELKSPGADRIADMKVTSQLNELARPLIMDKLADDLAQRIAVKPANIKLQGSSDSYTTTEQRKYADTFLVVKKMLEAEVDAEGSEDEKITKILALQEVLNKGSDKTIADAWFGITTPNAATTALEPGQKIALTGTTQEPGILNPSLPLYQLVGLKNPGANVVNNSMQKIASAIAAGIDVKKIKFNNGVVDETSISVPNKSLQTNDGLTSNNGSNRQVKTDSRQSTAQRSGGQLVQIDQQPKIVEDENPQEGLDTKALPLNKSESMTASQIQKRQELEDNKNKLNDLLNQKVNNPTTIEKEEDDAANRLKDEEAKDFETIREMYLAGLKVEIANGDEGPDNKLQVVATPQEPGTVTVSQRMRAIQEGQGSMSHQSSSQKTDVPGKNNQPAPAYGSKRSLSNISKSSSGSESFKTGRSSSGSNPGSLRKDPSNRSQIRRSSNSSTG